MAKAQFHKNQRVYVRAVGTWAQIEAVNPKWEQDAEEPIRILYDVGMGREFEAEELDSDRSQLLQHVSLDEGNWHIIRGQNKWRSLEECRQHPFPGTHPIIVTSEREWGGWRVPGSEYDQDPYRTERQARMIVNVPNFLALLINLIEAADDGAGQLSPGLNNVIAQARTILDEIESL